MWVSTLHVYVAKRTARQHISRAEPVGPEPQVTRAAKVGAVRRACVVKHLRLPNPN